MKETTMICNLTDLPGGLKNAFRGKAAVLGSMTRNGVPVPEGFAISTEMFHLYLAYNGFPYTPEQYLSHNEEIQKSIMQGEFSEDIRMALKKVYQSLNPKGINRVAVRSSAVCEDTQSHSMAGAFSSFVGLTACDELEDAVRKCYASLFSDKALSLMLRSGVNLKEIEMGVVIQEYVEGELSGVMFTVDSVAMDEDVLVINVVQGVCAGFVDGTRPSSLYRVDKGSGKVTSSAIADGGPALAENGIKMLLDAALHIEGLFGYPQDIEWTLRNGELFILQSRPVTAFKNSRTTVTWPLPEEDLGKTWMLENPNPLLPLTEEFLYIYYDGVTQAMLESGKGGGMFTKVLHGYSYRYFAPRDPDKRKRFREKLDQMNIQGRNIFQDEVLPQILQYKKELDRYLHRALSCGEILEFLEKSVEYYQEATYLHGLAVDGSMYLNDFRKYCVDIIPDFSEPDFYDLVYQTTLLGRERGQILEMAEYVKSQESLVLLLQSLPYDEILYARLSKSDAGIKLLEKIECYKKDFGLMAVKGQMQLVSPILLERPWEVVRKIRTCIDMDTHMFYKSIEKALSNKEKLKREIMEGLEEERGKEFIQKLCAAEKSFLVNDDHCYHIDLTSQGYLRLATLQCGEILASRGMIEQVEDIYFLTLEEIRTALSGQMKDMNSEVEKRKKTHEEHKKLIPPEYLGEAPNKVPIAEENGIDRNAVLLKGVSGLRKKTKGKVRVLKEGEELQRLEENCILVLKHGHGCYFLPFMNRIAGLIYDEGSPFDHPGILAREFEIPSLYKTKNATKVLNDGDWVELDGINSEARVIQRVKEKTENQEVVIHAIL